MKTLETLRVIVLILGLFIIGWLSNTAYRDYNYHREYNGLWLGDIQNKSTALETAQSYDTGGYWACTNVRDMTIEQIQETCIHESMHELFARECTKNMSKCMEVLK